MPCDWRAIENALSSWVRTASGLDTAHVYFGDQNGPQPATGVFITIRLGDIVPLGAYDSIDFSNQNLGAPNGTEIELRTFAPRSFTVSLQCFSAVTVTPGAVPATGKDILGKVQNALGLESVRYALNAAGLVPYDIGTVQNVSALLETAFEGRANLDVLFYTTDDISEFVGYINQLTPSTAPTGTYS